MAQLSLTDAGIARLRSAAQRLSAPADTDPATLVAWMGAVQSQDYPMGLWSIAQRLAKRGADVAAAVADGSILRTHVLRPTWHFVARDDLRWMQELTGPRILTRASYQDRRNGLDAARIARSMKAIAAAIAREGHLTRHEVGDALSRADIKVNAWLLGHLLMHAELRAVVCSGAPRGRHQTYALVDERAPKRPSMTRDEALAALAGRYFQSHGPATTRDFQWWSGLTAVDVARAVDLLGRALERITTDDRTYLLATSRPAARARPHTAQVTQTFDEIVVSYSESRAMVDLRGAVRGPGEGGAPLLTRGVICNGQLVARWTLPAARTTRTIAIEPLRRLSPAERRAVAAAAARFERFYFGAT